MSDNNINTTPTTQTHSAVKLNLLSLVLVTSLSGFCGGLVWAVITSLLDILGLIELIKFSSYITNFLTFPLIGLFFSAFFALLGYPLYQYFCQKIKGQKLSGLFINRD
jgi:ABC-type enterochelin transport system permease subunit